MPQLMMIVVALPAWWLVSRPGRLRRDIAMALLTWTAAGLLLTWLFPRATWELAVAALPLATLIIILGHRRTIRADQAAAKHAHTGPAHANQAPANPADGDQAHAGPAAPPRRLRAWPVHVLVALTVFVICGFGAFLPLEQSPDGPPSADLVLPLPDGLRATTEPSRVPCGNAVCMTHLTVTGRPGQSPADLLREVREHVTGRGYHPCRPLGLLLDRRTICAAAHERDGTVTISLELSAGPGI